MADGRRLRSTGLFEWECMERGERDRVWVEFQVRERVKAAPRRDDCGEADADVVVEAVVVVVVESVED